MPKITTKVQLTKTKNQWKRIAILTSGGDAPGMNMTVIALLRWLYFYHYQAYIVKLGLQGLIENNFIPYDYTQYYNEYENFYDSGTFIHSSRSADFLTSSGLKKAIQNLKQNQIDVLIIIGGDGSFLAAKKLIQNEMRVIGIPCTIDNDLTCTQLSIGFDSALNYIINHIKNIANIAKAFNYYFVVEIMGNACSHLSFAAAICTMADAIITPMNPWSAHDFVKQIQFFRQIHKNWGIFIVQEKYYGTKIETTYQDIIATVKKATGLQLHLDSIGYIQRCANPTAFELKHAAECAKFCVQKLLNKRKINQIVAYYKASYLAVDFFDSKNRQTPITKEKLQEINNLAQLNYFPRKK